MTAKYVIIEQNHLELPIIFNQIFNHSDFKDIGPIVSAGFVRITEIKEVDTMFTIEYQPVVVCYGESTTLKMKSRPDVDAEVIKRGFRK